MIEILLALALLLAVWAVFAVPLVVWAVVLIRRGDYERITCADLTNPRGPRLPICKPRRRP